MNCVVTNNIMNKIALILAIVIILLPKIAMAHEPGTFATELPETGEELERFEGIEIPYEEAVDNIVQLRNIGDLYDDVRVRLLCRTYIGERKYEIYSVEFKYSTRLLKDMYLFMSAGGEKIPESVENIFRRIFLLQ